MYKKFSKAIGLVIVIGLLVNPMMQRQSVADQVFLDDVIVDGSLCVGFDCVNGESFGFDTIRLKENNIRIHFDDTSNSASFPRNDWRIVINDTSNGGASYFGVEDSTANRIPFRVEAGARVNSLVVNSGGDVGLGTINPVVNLHVVDGNTPTLRLEQDGSQGFTAQTWDLAGNEANFFIRDTTNGSKLPFRIFPNAPTNSLAIEGSTGDLGVGLTAPEASIHVRRSNQTARILVEETSTTNATRGMLDLINNGPLRIDLRNTNNGGTALRWQFLTNAANTLNFTIPGTGGAEMALDASGNLTTLGTVNGVSDRNAKENIEAVDGNEILEKVTALPVSVWSYKHDKESVRHIGPMAQDFKAAFEELGNSDKTISYVDEIGVGLVAIKALHEKVKAKEAEMTEMADENSKLKSEVDEMKVRLERMEAVIEKLSNQ